MSWMSAFCIFKISKTFQIKISLPYILPDFIGSGISPQLQSHAQVLTYPILGIKMNKTKKSKAIKHDILEEE